MTYPRVHVGGENLPDPIEEIDRREKRTSDGAVYYPTRFKFLDDGDVIYLVYECEGFERRRWIKLSCVDFLDVYHEEEYDL